MDKFRSPNGGINLHRHWQNRNVQRPVISNEQHYCYGHTHIDGVPQTYNNIPAVPTTSVLETSRYRDELGRGLSMNRNAVVYQSMDKLARQE